MSHLPVELWVELCNRLNGRSLYHLARTNRILQGLAGRVFQTWLQGFPVNLRGTILVAIWTNRPYNFVSEDWNRFMCWLGGFFQPLTEPRIDLVRLSDRLGEPFRMAKYSYDHTKCIQLWIVNGDDRYLIATYRKQLQPQFAPESSFYGYDLVVERVSRTVGFKPIGYPKGHTPLLWKLLAELGIQPRNKGLLSLNRFKRHHPPSCYRYLTIPGCRPYL